MKILDTKEFSQVQILERLRTSRSSSEDVRGVVSPILRRVKDGGDKVLFELTERFEGVKLNKLEVSAAEIKRAYGLVDKSLVAAFKKAKLNIAKFHKTTICRKERGAETVKGVKVWREFRSIEKVGLYIPGGKAAYPSTVLMLGVPAQIAGCKDVIMCTPCGKDGTCNPYVLVAADLCGIKKIFKVGGAQAIGAMAYGTESIPKVYKIFGPGNQYVTTAKIMVYGEVDIDIPAGPSEVGVIADESANPSWIAADLLSQLEHGEDSQAVLVTTSESLAQKVICEIDEQFKLLGRQEIVAESLKISFAIVARNMKEACEIMNEYAPEHLEIVAKDKASILKRINNAGSIFLGKYSTEPLGDYATGSNHTLPTSGFAKMFSGLSAGSFGKMIQMQEVSKTGLQRLAKTVTTLADCEGLDAHGNAVKIRL